MGDRPDESKHYAMYRRSSLGTSLQWTLQEMVDSDSISKDLMETTLLQFDKSMCTKLADLKLRSNAKVNGQLKTYRNVDNVWNFILKETTFKIGDESVTTSEVKIVACDGRQR